MKWGFGGLGVDPFGKYHLSMYHPHYEKKLTKNIRPTDVLQIYTKHLVNVLKFTKYLVNVHKFTKYLVNSYHQKGAKHYVLTNWNQITPI